MTLDSYRKARRRILLFQETPILDLEAVDGTKLRARYVPSWGQLSSAWDGNLHHPPGEEVIQFYLRSSGRPDDDSIGSPQLHLPERLILKRRLKNGALRLSPGRSRNGYPKRYSRKLASTEVERLLAWLPEARAAAKAEQRRAVKEHQSRERETLIALLRERQALRYSPRLSPARRPTALAERVQVAAAFVSG